MDISNLKRYTVDIQDGVFLIGLNRTDKINAFDALMIKELSDLLTYYEAQDDLRCAMIFAHGNHFTAGLDLSDLQDKNLAQMFIYPSNKVDPWGVSGMPRSKPYVVAVQGICFTAGIELMLNADIVIASTDCRFAQMEVLRGLMPFGGATHRFIKAAGWQKAMPYLLTGDEFDANTAFDLNLVSKVVATEDVYKTALDYAVRISTQSSTTAIKALIKSAKEGFGESEFFGIDSILGHMPELFKSDDFAEGINSLIEKRKANFK